jgi:hypothetical protein
MSEPKTRSLGQISVAKFVKHAEWKAYVEAAVKFQETKTSLNSAKSPMREMLKKHSPSLSGVENLEFTMTPSKKEIAVFEKLQTRRTSTASNELEFDSK